MFLSKGAPPAEGSPAQGETAPSEAQEQAPVEPPPPPEPEHTEEGKTSNQMVHQSVRAILAPIIK